MHINTIFWNGKDLIEFALLFVFIIFMGILYLIDKFKKK